MHDINTINKRNEEIQKEFDTRQDTGYKYEFDGLSWGIRDSKDELIAVVFNEEDAKNLTRALNA
jgi:hypothetical protein